VWRLTLLNWKQDIQINALHNRGYKCTKAYQFKLSVKDDNYDACKVNRQINMNFKAEKSYQVGFNVLRSRRAVIRGRMFTRWKSRAK
jgi:hypothetical protein